VLNTEATVSSETSVRNYKSTEAVTRTGTVARTSKFLLH